MFVAGIDGCRGGWVSFKVDLASLNTSVELIDLPSMLRSSGVQARSESVSATLVRADAPNIEEPVKAAGQKGYSLPVGFLFQEEGAPLPGRDLGGSTPEGRAPMSYDSVYPTFRPAVQARNGLGRGLRGGHLAAMSRL
jgi:hypothetical protein